MWAYVLVGIFGIVSIVEFIYILSLKRNIQRILDSFSTIISSDTNSLIIVDTSNPKIRELAILMNRELKQLHKERLKLQKGDHELKNVITNVAHDLRTPLTAINGYLELLEEESVNENVARYLDIIRERTESLKRLVEDLFKYSVITSVSEELELSSLSLKSELEIALAASYGMLCEKGIEPVIEFCDGDVIKKCNHAALQRVFSNILNNCAKYSDGDLMVELEENGTIIFSNTAKNLSQVDVEKLFDRFYTVESGKESTGLGLSIAKTLMEKMNGSIYAKYVNDKIYIIIQCHE